MSFLTKLASGFAIVAVGFFGSLEAQNTSPKPMPQKQPQTKASDVSTEELSQFTDIQMTLQPVKVEIQKTKEPEQRKALMQKFRSSRQKAINNSDLSQKRYVQIARGIQTNPKLQQKWKKHLQKNQ